jgi:hypothetical protein
VEKGKVLKRHRAKGKDIEQDAPTDLHRSLHHIQEGTETMWFSRKTPSFHENRRDSLFLMIFTTF